MNPIRVLMVTSEWPSATLPFCAPYLVRQVDFLRRAGMELEVFSFRGGGNPLNYWQAWRQLRRVLRQQKFDLIHAQFGQAALLAWPRWIPLVVTFHGCDLQGVKRPDGRMSAGGWMLQRMCQLIARRAEGVIIVSERMRQFLPPGTPATVIPTGLDFEEIPLMPQAQARRQLGLPPDQRLVLFVGNPAEPVKRYPLARRAVEILKERCSAELVVGCGRPRADILLMMNACDALLVTSIQEGSPCVVKEALACCLPIVSLNVGDVPVRVHGVQGCEICADERPECIAASLERVLAHRCRTRGREAVQDLDERILTAKIVGVYRAVLDAWARRPGRLWSRFHPAQARHNLLRH